MSSAFKEWQVIVDALGAGAQTLVLRKGGITEGRSGFAVKASRFWLFPTQFHAQREKTKPAADAWFPGPSTPTADITLRYHAEVVQTAFLADWDAVARLDSFHLWTEATIRERFDWATPPGVHVLVLRVHRLDTPIVFSPTAKMGGCTSWIELPFRLEDCASQPVLDDAAFAKQREQLAAVLPGASE